MTKKDITPLRERMIEDMRIRGLGEKAQNAHIRVIKGFASYLGRSSPWMFNIRITSLRFFFSITCVREDMKRYMQFQRKPFRLPVVLSVQEVGDLMAAVPGPGLKYLAALGISYGAGLRASEVCNLKITNIDSNRMLIHVDNGKGGRDRKEMLSPGLLTLLRDCWLEAHPQGWLFPGKQKINPMSPRQLNGGSRQPSIWLASPN